MPEQSSNPPLKPISKDSSDLSSDVKEIVAGDKRVSKSAEDANKALQRRIEYEAMRLKIATLVTEKVILERAVDEIKSLAIVNKQQPKVEGLLAQLASKEEELENLLKKNNLKISKKELQDQRKSPKKWWQIWRSQLAADLLEPSKH